MATPKLNYERAARVLADAYFFGRPTACEKHGISSRTLERYEAARKSDDELSVLSDKYRDEIAHREWADQLSETLTTALRRIGVELIGVEVKSLEDVSQLMHLTKELMELEMSRMYAEADTRDDTDAYAGQRQGSSYPAPGQTAETFSN